MNNVTERTRHASSIFRYAQYSFRQLKFAAAQGYGVQECDARMFNHYS